MTHYGRDASMDTIRSHVKGPHLHRTVQSITQACQICAKNDPKTEPVPIKKGVHSRGLRLFEN